MRAHEYMDKVTAYIASPARALEVRRELEAHLREAAAEVQAQGIDPETAELVAVARMGPPEKVALALAEAHHEHLPWRHYLAVIPILAMVSGMTEPFYPPWYLFWSFCLVFCLLPRRATLVRLAWLVWIDVRAKYRWMVEQPLYECIVPGVAAGATAGLLLGLMPPWGVKWPVFLMLAVTLITGTALLFHRHWTGSFMLKAGFATLAFPIVLSLALVLLGREFAYIPVLIFSIIFALFALGVGWLVTLLQGRGEMRRADLASNQSIDSEYRSPH